MELPLNTEILIVEDDEAIRNVLSKFLEENGVHVTLCIDGEEALEAIWKQSFDCVLLDLIMPRVSGFEVLKALRLTYSRTDLPVIIMTGERDRSFILKGFDFGANDYVIKPFDLNVLMMRILTHLEIKTQALARGTCNFMVDGIKPGSRFGNFDILELLGSGGMGVVFRAKDVTLDRVVALKTLHPYLEMESKQISRFKQEAKIIANLNHPNIVKILEIGSDPQNYFTMEYVPGQCLSEYILNQNVSISEKVQIVAKTASALQAAHEKMVIHRDVKPSNIMLDTSNSPKLLDFGTAKIMESTAHLTLSADVIGTPVYMAPEQVETEDVAVDEQTDVYSLGIVLYELLTGGPPFVGPTVKVIWQIINQNPVPLRLINVDIPAELEEICMKAISKNKNHRFQSAREFSTSLKSLKL